MSEKSSILIKTRDWTRGYSGKNNSTVETHPYVHRSQRRQPPCVLVRHVITEKKDLRVLVPTGFGIRERRCSNQTPLQWSLLAARVRPATLPPRRPLPYEASLSSSFLDLRSNDVLQSASATTRPSASVRKLSPSPPPRLTVHSCRRRNSICCPQSLSAGEPAASFHPTSISCSLNIRH
jgi:hypothetical protein